ncbi:MAG: hypothetical protein HY735_13020 [Verrucomicrobia bacterium]|nr:hypothetical protein [Verrucomicrobiota bacterium]
MMSSETQTKVEALLAALNEEALFRQIDEPIKRARELFRWQEPRQRTHWVFMELLIGLVEFLSPKGTRQSQTPADAYAKAIRLLDQQCSRGKGRGSEEALLDFLGLREGAVEIIVECIAQALANEQRQRVVQEILTAHLPVDWEARCEVVETFLSICREVLPPEVMNCSPAQITDCVESLILTIAQSQSSLGQMLAAR